MTKKLTEMQEKFLDVLFTEAKGNLVKAKKLAGYSSKTPTREVVTPIAEEIVEKTNQYLALNGPKAAVALIDIISRPSDLGNKTKLAAVRDLLDRAGFKAAEKVEISAPDPVFILPAKE